MTLCFFICVGVATNDNIIEGNKWTTFYSVKQLDSPSTLRTYWGGAYQTNTDSNNNYYDTPKYVVDVIRGAVSKTYRRLPESRNHRHIFAP